MVKAGRIVIGIGLLLMLVVTPIVAMAARQMTLAIDATDSPRNILHAHETLQVEPGSLTLFYPKWIPGEHAPTGPIVDLVGLKISANGTPVTWRRDLVEMHAIRCEVPREATTLELSFDFILSTVTEGYSGSASSTPGLLVLSWNDVVLYPENEKPDDITVTPSVRIQEGWKYGTALTTESEKNNEIRFASVSLTMLIDSPVQMGAHFRSVDISPASGPLYHIDMVSDNKEALEMSPSKVAKFKHLVAEANALFGAHHFAHYDFLYTLSDLVTHFGLEHHQSSDDRTFERALLDHQLFIAQAGLLPHEFVHSWNGKYRRPAGLATGNYSTPMKDDLLWVYEGLTTYLGNVLTARSGLRTPDEYRENLALVAAGLDNKPGRTWRTLQDANDDASILYSSRSDWTSLRRSVDFYDEGDLIWLEADVTIRNLTGGKKSLDDFCKLFHGGTDTTPIVKPYTFDDVVATMNRVVSHDWRNFFVSRLESLSPHAPLGGIEMGGWKLSYADTASEMQQANERARKTLDERYSLGLQIAPDGELRDVIVGSPAGTAGLIPRMKLISVDGKQYSPEALHQAVRSAKGTTSPIRIVASQGSYVMSFTIDYHGGERYPVLERVDTKPDLLGQIIAPTASK